MPDRVEYERPSLPLKFVDALRGAYDAGLTRDQIISIVNLVSQTYSLMDEHHPEELQNRCRHLLKALPNHPKGETW